MTRPNIGWMDAQERDGREHDVRIQHLSDEVIRRSKHIEELKSEITAEIRMLRAAAKEISTLTISRIREAKEYAKDPN